MPDIMHPFEPGEILAGGYRMEEPIAMGGVGIVYAATRLADEKPVAVKILRLDVAEDDPAATDRFIREAAVVSRFEHPNLVRIFDFGESDSGLLYMALEQLTGQCLDHIIDAGALPASQAQTLLRQILQGLQAAHAEGLMHRDLKPGNVFICGAGADATGGTGGADCDCGPQCAKLLDFGLAKGLPQRPGVMDQTLTVRGQLVGTPGYIAPEMLKHQSDWTPLVDLYAAGIIGHEMLTGQLAFAGEGVDRCTLQVIQDPPAPSPDIADLPLYAVVRRLFDRNPARRFQSADAALIALDALD